MSKGLITPMTTAVTKEKFEESLAQWKPVTKKESIRMLHFISSLTKYSKNIKDACYYYLQNSTATSQNAVFRLPEGVAPHFAICGSLPCGI